MNKIIAILFAITCFATSILSNSIMGAGLWFWVILSTGLVVVASQHIESLRGVGSLFAVLLSFISVFAVLFGLVAATIGGSFHLDDNEALLLFLFFIIAILGFALGIIYKKSLQNGNV